MFTIEPVTEVGSIYVRESTEAEQLKLAFESVRTVESEANVVKALSIMLGSPGISGNKVVEQMHIQKSSWSQLRAVMETRHYIESERNDKGNVIRMSVTEHGADWLTAKQEEVS
jgi:DNA-binding MarR family transcriptional regulator